jgi:hypothetical protein
VCKTLTGKKAQTISNNNILVDFEINCSTPGLYILWKISLKEEVLAN